MHPYRISLLAFAATVGLFFAVAAGAVFLAGDRFPAPRLSDSVSFNEKALWLRKAFQQGRSADIIVAGSSMGVNNLDAGEIARITGTQAIVNTSSWGMCIPQSFELLRTVLDRLHPKLVIVPVYFGDFQKAEIVNFDWDRFNECLFGPSLLPFYLRSLDGIYYAKKYRRETSKEAMNRQVYDSLHFDPYGGVLLSSEHFVYEQKRWDGTKDQALDETAWDPVALADLKETSLWLRQKKIALLVVACPMRQPMERILAAKVESDLWSKLPELLKGSDARFVHIAGGPDFEDSCFADYAHLNEKGARKLTDLLAPTLVQMMQARAAW